MRALAESDIEKRNRRKYKQEQSPQGVLFFLLLNSSPITNRKKQISAVEEKLYISVLLVWALRAVEPIISTIEIKPR
jgi:hypothetical protein